MDNPNYQGQEKPPYEALPAQGYPPTPGYREYREVEVLFRGIMESVDGPK